MSKRHIIIIFLFVFSINVLKANPNADFKLSVKQGCVPLTVSYTNMSTGSGLSYLWEFGNGNQSTLANPSAIYYQSGNFKVTLTVTDANGLKSVKVYNPIRVFKNPSANFSSDTVGCIGDQLNFKDLSIDADTVINQWTWDFGDGLLDYTKNPKHNYSYSSTFTIGLTIIDGFGCKSLVTKQKHIRIKPSPTAKFVMDKTYSCQLPGVFTASNKSTNSQSYEWFSSDGKRATTTDFTTNFTSYGVYSLYLVANYFGCKDTFKYEPLVTERLVARIGNDNGPACAGGEFAFTNETTPNSSMITFEWDFGDGQTSTSKSATHVYQAPGLYTVKLKAKFGPCVEEVTKQVNVHPSPDVEISVLDSIGCEAPFNAIFRINGNDYVSSFWTFGDESPKDQYYPKGKTIGHTYSNSGEYPVSARVMNSYGCAQYLDLQEKINVGMQSVEIDPKSMEDCLPKTQWYRAIENLKQPVLRYNWLFTDSSGNQYTTKDVKKIFTKPGDYSVYLELETVYGCILKDSASVSVGNKYKPSFKILKQHICGYDTIIFKNTSHDSLINNKDIKYFITLQDSGSGLDDTASRSTLKTVQEKVFLKSGHGGWHSLKIAAKHFGCVTESDAADSVYAHGPYIRLEVDPLNCRNDRVLVQNKYSWGNRYELKKDSTILRYDTGDFEMDYKREVYKFTAWNDTFSCKEELYRPHIFPYKIHNPGLTHTMNQDCTPARITFMQNGTLKESKWITSEGDTSKLKNFSVNVNKAGIYTIKLIGYYDSTYCMDTLERAVKVNGVELRSRVVSAGKCLPIQLSLYDSLHGKDNSLHTWIINGQEIVANSFKTDFSVNKVIGGDSVIRVIHKIVTQSGCSGEKEFVIPYGGAKANYSMKRFTICDTPMFYFKTQIDSSKTSFPITYEWKMSDGSSSNQANFNSKFKTIGMNYYNLTITDRTGCKVNFYDSFEVSPNMLQPLFNADPTGRFCPPLKCQFMDMSKSFVSEIVKWEWDFGDGTTSQEKNPQKLYLLPGKYDLTLKVTSFSGCTATLVKPGYVIVNGPRGAYDFDRGNACLPHTVQFRGTAFDSATMEWDLGDGVVQQGNYFRHTYNLPGRYIPAMILSDTLGCKYTLPPIDTIEVFAYPEAKLAVNGLCLKQPITVSQRSISKHNNPTLKYQWYFNGMLKNPGKDSIYMPESRGEQKIRLIVENIGKCKDTSDFAIRIFAPKTNFELKDKFVCLGLPVTFINTSTSDTSIATYDWDLGDGSTNNGSQISHTYTSPGTYDIRLITKDVLNCYDTLLKPKVAIVGDTILPPLVPIRRVSVLNNREVELVYSKFPNFDFNSYTVYRENNGVYYKMAVVDNMDDTVFVDRQCQTLNNSYCYKIRTKNLCLFNSDITLSKAHCTIETKAEGLLEANRVKWSPYIGFDKILQYQIWRSEPEKPMEFKLLDSVSGKELSYIDSSILCHTRENYKIKALQQGGFKEYSFSDTASAQPYFINTLKPNEIWRTTVENNQFTQLEWINNAWSKRGIKGYLLSKSFADGSPIFNNRYFNAADTVFVDETVKVNTYSYLYNIRAIDNCLDTSPWSNPAQSILLKGDFNVTANKPQIQWNHYQLWYQGLDHYEIERKLPNGQFVVVGSVEATVNIFVDESAETSCVPYYIYRVRAYSNIHNSMMAIANSLSNETQVFPNSKLFVPNAFSPDNNGINERFGPNGQYITNYNIKIFNRWGEKLFESSDCMASWDGMSKGEVCQQDAYMYVIEAKGADNKIYNLSGSFHLLR